MHKHSTVHLKPVQIGTKGIFIGLTILTSWLVLLSFLLTYTIHWNDPLVYLFVLAQTHLFTGVFITLHDSIHGLVAPNFPRVNRWIGRISAIFFAYNNYDTLYKNHHLHHKHPASAEDPDYHSGNPSLLAWWFSFLLQYISVWQVLAMASTFTVLYLWFPVENLIVFWVVPAWLSTIQLFIFGTYLPHRGDHHQPPHYARSQGPNHTLAFLSCYFFGYHYEHHAYPYLPWWKLAEAREQTVARSR